MYGSLHLPVFKKTGSSSRFRRQDTGSAFPFTIVCAAQNNLQLLSTLLLRASFFFPKKRRSFLLPKIWQAPQTSSDKCSLRQFTTSLFAWAAETVFIKLVDMSEQLYAFPAFIPLQLMWFYDWHSLLYYIIYFHGISYISLAFYEERQIYTYFNIKERTKGVPNLKETHLSD